MEKFLQSNFIYNRENYGSSLPEILQALSPNLQKVLFYQKPLKLDMTYFLGDFFSTFCLKTLPESFIYRKHLA